jgi:hypothetical protein
LNLPFITSETSKGVFEIVLRLFEIVLGLFEIVLGLFEILVI